jgi:large subunit ribosomal protein L24e
MPRCSYCKENYSIPKGMTLVKTDGTIVHLCSSKCRKNMLMKRRKVRWISKKKKDKTRDVKKVEKASKDVPSAPENVNAEGKKDSKKKIPKKEVKRE